MSRRRRLRLARTVVVLTTLIVVAHALVSRGASGNPGSTSQTVKISTRPSADAQSRVSDPFQQPAVRDYLAAHPGMTAAIHDLTNDKVWAYEPVRHDTMASIMKVDILETMLQAHGVLTDDNLENATGMIENSSNDDAEDLWEAAGGAAGVSSYNTRIGLTGTSPNTAGYWGLSTTTARDQVRLLDHLAIPNPVLTDAERRQALQLMHTVELDQRWGVSAGLPHGTPIAIKNGWLPLDNGSGWQVNSDGIVASNGYHYDISVLSTGDASEAAGIKKIEDLTKLLWPLLGPAR
jgi:hypothetical protein